MTTKRTAKSILFLDTDLNKVYGLAKDLGYTRLSMGREVADTSKVVQRAVRFMLSRPEEFKLWLINANGKEAGE